MSWDPGAAWQAVAHSPMLGLALTLGGYELSVRLWRRVGRHPVANPVLVSIVVIGLALTVLRIGYRDYLAGAQFIGLLLGPATVALALPLYRQAARIRAAALGILLAVLVGASTAVVSAVLIVRVSGGGESLERSMAPKSATTPIALALAERFAGIPALTAVFTILTGVLGAIAGPPLLNLLRVRDRTARGLALGVSSHGVGTAQALHEDPVVGALAGLGMALSAVVTPVVLPLLLGVLG